MSFVEVVELFLKSKFVFVVTFVTDYGKSVIYLVELRRRDRAFRFVSYFFEFGMVKNILYF